MYTYMYLVNKSGAGIDRRGLTLAETEGQDRYSGSICACCKNSAVQEVTSY